jgi:hypothetical protein
MKITAMISNLILFGFVCLSLVEDGPPVGTLFFIFTLWWMMTLVFNSIVICQIGTGNSLLDNDRKRRGFDAFMKERGLPTGFTIMRGAGIVLNSLYFVFSCWAVAGRFSNKKEDVMLAFDILMLLNPILSLFVLMRSKPAGFSGKNED